MTQSVILHVGLHKTATSSIQKTLVNNRDALRDAGIGYGAFTNFRGDDHRNHSLPFYAGFAQDYQNYTHFVRHKLNPETERQRLLIQIEQNLDEASGPILFSGEEISNLSIDELSSLRRYFEKRNIKLRVICFVRSPYAMTCSDGQEWLKTGRRYRVAHRQSMPAVKRLGTVFSSAEFYSFKTACVHPSGPVGFFLDLIGVPPTDKINIATANEGLCDQVVRMIAHINDIGPIHIDGNPSSLRSLFDTSPLWKIVGDKYQLLESEYGDIEQGVTTENKLMHNMLGAEYCDLTIPLYKVPPAWSSSSIETLMEVLGKVSPAIAAFAVSHFYAESIATPAQRDLLGEKLASLRTGPTPDAMVTALDSFIARKMKNNREVAIGLADFKNNVLS